MLAIAGGIILAIIALIVLAFVLIWGVTGISIVALWIAGRFPDRTAPKR